MELYDDHPFARVGVADDDITEQANLSPKVEEGETVGDCIVAYFIADLVVQVVHQPALLDGQDLVERPGDMESDGGRVLDTIAKGGDVFPGQPALVGATEVELVTVFLCLHAAEDRTEFRKFDLADTRELVEDLLLLKLQLLRIRQVLPFATAADTEVLTERFHAYITILYKAHYLALGEGVFLATDLHVAHITGHAEGYEHHQVIPVEQALAFGCHSLYGHALKER